MNGILSSTFTFLIIVSIITLYVYENGQPTCKHYVMNTYLYLALAASIVSMTVFFLKDKQLNPSFFFLSFIFLISLIFTSPDNLVISHIFWVLLIITLSLGITSLISNNVKQDILQGLYLVATVFIVTTFIGFIFFDKLKSISSKIGLVLLIALISIILFEFTRIFIIKKYTKPQRRIFDIIVIILFSFFLVFDTVEMQKRAQTCSLSNIKNFPNYPIESFNFFIDLVNIFVRSIGR